MSRPIVALFLAGTFVAGPGTLVLAQAPAPTQSSADPSAAPATTTPASAKPPTPAARAQIRAEKRELRVAALANCRAHGKQQSLRSQALKDFVKSCMAQAPR